VEVAIQAQPLGTADAMQAAEAHIDADSVVIVLNGDHPLVSADTLRSLSEAHARSRAAATMVTAILDDPTGYGRVVRAPDGTVERVVETKAEGDASELELHIREINTGIFAFEGGALLSALQEVGTANAQGERYLPDVLPVLRAHERTVLAHEITDPGAVLGINDRRALARARALAQEQILERHMLAGVTIVDPFATAIDVEVEIGQDSVVAPFTSLHGVTTVGARCTLGPLSTVLDSRIADQVSVIHSYVREATLEAGVTVGPFAYLRPGAVLRPGAKAGTFVEIKNSEIGRGAKVPHLSYIGDAEIGEGTNIGAATVTANYDGSHKHRTEIGAHAFVGVDTMLVAPVKVGDRAYTGAGSVITGDVPPDALGVARARQRNIEGYVERRKQREEHAEKHHPGH
jgi:bifunctional UDP-N-acetylglucosamine pyrophosphorylase/glucosamine-1-phosphate N-acetyltransferase